MIRAGVRSTGERGIGVFLVASLMLHAGVLGFLLFHRKPLSLGYLTATTVALIPENQLAPEAQAPPANPSPPAPPAPLAPPAPPVPPQKKITPAPPPPPPPPRPVHRAPAPRVIHRPPVPRPVRKPVRRPVRKVEKKVSAKKPSVRKVLPHRKAIVPSKATTKESVRKTQSSKAAPAAVSNPVPVHMDLAGTHFPSYLQHLLISRIKSNWSPPPGSHGRSVTVSFILRKNGELDGEPVLVTRSGSPVFDDAARYAILRSVPFPPFPSSYGKEKEAVTVTLQATKRQGF